MKAQEEYGEDSVEAGRGAEAIKKLLVNLDLKAEKEKLRGMLDEVKSKVCVNFSIKYPLY